MPDTGTVLNRPTSADGIHDVGDKHNRKTIDSLSSVTETSRKGKVG